MKSARLKLVFLVTLVIVLTSAMTTASTGSEYLCLDMTTNGNREGGIHPKYAQSIIGLVTFGGRGIMGTLRFTGKNKFLFDHI